MNDIAMYFNFRLFNMCVALVAVLSHGGNGYGQPVMSFFFLSFFLSFFPSFFSVRFESKILWLIWHRGGGRLPAGIGRVN